MPKSPQGCHDPWVSLNKLSTTNAFVITDLEGAPQSAGPVRLAKKVLQGSTAALARSATYAFAHRGLQVGGVAAGISAEPADRDTAIAAFLAEIAPRLDSGELIIDAGSGVSPDDLAPATGGDPRSPLRLETVESMALADYLTAVSAVAAAQAARGGLDGASAAVESGPAAAALTTLLTEQGATVTEFGADGLATLAADIVFCGSRQGMIDGGVAATIDTKLVIPTGCQPVSAKGLAVLTERGIVALADFVTTSGATHAGWPGEATTVDEAVQSTRDLVSDAVTADLEHPAGPFLGACLRAENFLSTWQENLPFGRPLA